jgi:hypothetical protein
MQFKPVSGNALSQRRDLAINRMIAGLPLARHPRIERNRFARAHASPLRRFAVIALTCGGPTWPRVGGSLARRTTGTRQA